MSENMKPASQVLEEAAELLEERGWTQGKYANDRGELCSVGALRQVGHNWAWEVAYPALGGFLGRNVIEWNDHPGRTKEEVIDALMGVAKQLRDEGR